MAAGSKTVTVVFKGDKKNLDKALDGVQSKSEKVSAKMSSIGKGMTIGLTAPIVAGAAKAVIALGEIEKISAQTDAAIESTGGVANVTGAEVAGLADELEKLTSVEAESIQEGQNLLLTFTNIRNEAGEGNDIFDQTTKALVDMSVAMGTDAKTEAIRLGKALNDPIKGVSALSKAGVQFTDDQKEMIASLVEAGDTMGAQKIILAELNTQFGGSAEALGETMQGRIAKVGNSFGEMSETLASMLLPAIEGLTGWLQRLADWFNNMDPAAQKFIGILLAVVAAVGPMLIIGAKLVSSFGIIKKAWAGLNIAFSITPWGALIAGIVVLVTLIVLNWDKITAFLKKTWDWIKTTASALWDWIKQAFKTGLDFVVNLFLNWTLPGLLIKHWDTIKDGVTAVKDFIVDTWEGVLDWFRLLPSRMGAAVGDLFGGIRDAFKAAVNWVIDKWNNWSFKAGFNLPSIFGGGRVEVGFDTPNIPRLHAGGVFQPPAGQSEGLALLRRGEVVNANGGSGDIYLTVNAGLGINPHAVGEQIVAELVKAQRRGVVIPSG